ncbi:MAG: peptidoglycan-associated lipoprotein Pal [Gammaproteobacteria bacterium]|nr:peptidoglycan-associated lipoprotein Pal [Gammaproteobacteria bacterium]
MTHFKKLTFLLLTTLVITTGCAKQQSRSDDGGSRVDGSGSSSSSSSSSSGMSGDGMSGSGVDTAVNLLDQKVIYFDFDRSNVRSEFDAVIAAHANNIGRKSVVLEGHADERGSREYNIGLGERRAQAVRRALMLNGVKASKISTRSYGEERPAMSGHNESAWAKNRRVVISY